MYFLCVSIKAPCPVLVSEEQHPNISIFQENLPRGRALLGFLGRAGPPPAPFWGGGHPVLRCPPRPPAP